MRALVWITLETWQATVDHARTLLPEHARVTLLVVSDDEAETLASAAGHGLLGRPPHDPAPGLRAIADDVARDLLRDAADRLACPAATEHRHGPPEHEVIAAAGDADLLVLARDGDLDRLGPRSIGHATRFVVDHAPCTVALVWPRAAPDPSTIPPRPRPRP